MRRGQLAIVAFVVLAGGVALRWRHLGAPSLWWDEVVEIRTAGRSSVVEVLGAVRDGAAPGTGNAGAMPLDYLALHAWNRVAPVATADTLEVRWRMPSFAFSVAALPLAWLVGLAAGGASVAMAMLALVATSLPLVLYAAEARPYSAFVAASLLGLLGYLRLLERPSGAGRRIAWFAASLVGVLTLLYGVFPVGAQAGALALDGVRDPGRRRDARGVIRLVLVVAAVVLAWLGAGVLGTVYVRPAARPESAPEALLRIVDFFAGSSTPLRIALLAGLVGCLPLAFGADARLRVLARSILLTPLALPVILWLARSQNYYLHPRHALFFLPSFLLGRAMLLGRCVESLFPGRSAATRASLALAAALLITAPPVRAYLSDPLVFFRQVKTLRDFRGLAREIAARAGALPRSERMLVVAEKRRPGHLANPVLAFYLAVHGVGGRTVLRGSGDPSRTIDRLLGDVPPRCKAEAGAWSAALDLGDPFTQSLPMRMLLGMPVQALPPGPICRVGLVIWSKAEGGAATAGFDQIAGDGWTLLEARDPGFDRIP